MKKTIMAIAAAVMMCTTVMAQEADNQRQPRRMDRTEMMKQRTEQMVKEYGLNDEQAKRLETLNAEYAEKMPMMMGGPRGPRGGMRGERGGMRGERPQGNMQRPMRPDSAQQGGMRQPRGERPQFNREEMQKNMEAYNTELQKIMTPEQYEKYRSDMEKRMQGPRGGQRNRPTE